MITIAIPAYNQEDIIEESIASCQWQNYTDKEILVVDDCSTDKTAEKCCEWKGVRVIKNKANVGFAKNLELCKKNAKGDIIVYLCGDDMFAHPNVIGDIAEIFEANPDVGIVDRNYFQYMDGYAGAVVEVRERNVIISSVNPSGMGFRKSMMKEFSNKIYVEVPTMVKEMIKYCRWVKLEYDTVAVRIHKKNQAVSPAYYKGSLIQNWHDLLGSNKVLWDFKSNYICLKNRSGLRNLLREIKINIDVEPDILFSLLFYFYAIIAIMTPRWILIPLSDFYRHRISRRFCSIQWRKDEDN